MLFNSEIFVLVFFPAVILLYYSLSQFRVTRQWLLIVSSLVFYGWWDLRFVPLMTSQAVVTWLILRTAANRRTVAVYAVVAANLSILFLFKYYHFFADTLREVFAFQTPAISVILPLGISFYTFEIVSYAIDYKKGDAPQYKLRHFLLYILYFPHLIAGPIVRHHELIPQFDDDPLRPGLSERLWLGLCLFTIGLAKKVLIADELARIADPVFTGAAAQMPSFAKSWEAGLAFSLQLYFDFSGYSDMAIGMALMMGFVLPLNFNKPYRATNIQDFWRRWHMTLSRFFRDYVYIPLGGSRSGEKRYLFAVMATMALVGLWHGAGWTFVVWGLSQAFALLTYRYWSLSGGSLSPVTAWLITMLFVLCGWVMFRSPDFATALSMYQAMFSFDVTLPTSFSPILLVAAFISIAVPASQDLASSVNVRHFEVAAGIGLLLAVCVLVVGEGKPTAFIYFQF